MHKILASAMFVIALAISIVAVSNLLLHTRIVYIEYGQVELIKAFDTCVDAELKVRGFRNYDRCVSRCYMALVYFGIEDFLRKPERSLEVPWVKKECKCAKRK